MGIDLGVNHLAVVSLQEVPRVGPIIPTEIARYFITPDTALRSTLNPSTLRLESIACPPKRGWSVRNRLWNLRQAGKTFQTQLASIAPASAKAYHVKRTRAYHWEKMNHYHRTIVQTTANLLVSIAVAYGVRSIQMENLRWTRASSRADVGGWLAHNQVHWLHSQLQMAIESKAALAQISIKRVDARNTSQLCSHLSHAQSVRGQGPLGSREGKQFRCRHTDHGGRSYTLHADLNAARNIARR